MFIKLSRNWWWLAFRGLAAILFGFIALAWHGSTLRSYMILFGSFALLDGLLAIFTALTSVAGNKRWRIVLHGLLSIDIAIFAFIWTDLTASILLYLLAAWALITGFLELVKARELRQHIYNERLLHLTGIATIIFAVLIILLPQIGMLSIAEVMGSSAILLGLLMLAFSLNVRSLGKYTDSLSHQKSGVSLRSNRSLSSYAPLNSFKLREQNTATMLTVIFDSVPSALKGVITLKDLDRVKTITLHATAVIAKDSAGKVSIKQAAEREFNGTFFGLLSGILLGVFGGPARLALGALIGALAGLIVDLSRSGISADFLKEAANILEPGQVALLAEIDETSILPVNIRLAKLGGHVYRQSRSEFIDEQLRDELDTINVE